MSEYQYYEFTAVDKPLNEKEMALAREKYLESLSGQEDSMWKKVDKNIDSKQPAKYDEAV